MLTIPSPPLCSLPNPPQVNLYTEQCAPWLLAPESLNFVVTVLQGEHLEGAPVPASLQQQLLDAVLLSLQIPGAAGAGPSEELVRLYEVVRTGLASSGDFNVRNVAGEVLKLLKPLVQ